MAVITTGNGGYDKLIYREAPVPTLERGEVLLQVLAAGVNNTDFPVAPWSSRFPSATPPSCVPTPDPGNRRC
jgi:NADPH:quinone reductase-like Zn-dependent oxidoreductase